MDENNKVAVASREIMAPAARIFELIADPAHQPSWDGNGNLAEAADGQRVTKVGDVFTMLCTLDVIRENHVVEFEEGRLIAWCPAEPGSPPPGHLWRWELSVIDDRSTRVTHTYDWTRLVDPNREQRAKATTSSLLQSSVDRLAEVAEAD